MVRLRDFFLQSLFYVVVCPRYAKGDYWLVIIGRFDVSADCAGSTIIVRVDSFSFVGGVDSLAFIM